MNKLNGYMICVEQRLDYFLVEIPAHKIKFRAPSWELIPVMLKSENLFITSLNDKFGETVCTITYDNGIYSATSNLLSCTMCNSDWCELFGMIEKQFEEYYKYIEFERL